MDLLQVAVTAVGAFAALFLLSKLMGHRQISELSVFDYVNGITIGSIAAEMATELEKPLRPLVAMVVWALLVWLLEALTSKCPRLRKYISGSPSIVFDNGKLYRRNMKKARLDLSEFLIQCRQQGFFDLGAIQTAVYEPDGRLTILPVAARRPVQRAMAEELGLLAVPLTDLAAAAAAFDTVVNTIPAPVLTAAVLAALPKGCLIVDLASKPGGTDFAAARRLGHTALHALSLPTVWAPETAGEALARTVQTILQEREEKI